MAGAQGSRVGKTAPWQVTGDTKSDAHSKAAAIRASETIMRRDTGKTGDAREVDGVPAK